MSRENTLAAVFTEELKQKFFVYLQGFTDNIMFSDRAYEPYQYSRTKFWHRYGPVTNFREQEIEEQLRKWIIEFCETQNYVTFKRKRNEV